MANLDDHNALLLFRVGPVLCCAPSLPIETIISPPHLTHPPGTSTSQPGIFKHGNHIVKVTDLRYRFGVDETEWLPGRIVITRLEDTYIGFWVDEIIDVIIMPADGWSNLPALIPRGIFSRTWIKDKKIHLYSELEKLAALQQTGYLKSYIEHLHQKQVKEHRHVKTTEAGLTIKPNPQHVTKPTGNTIEATTSKAHVSKASSSRDKPTSTISNRSAEKTSSTHESIKVTQAATAADQPSTSSLSTKPEKTPPSLRSDKGKPAHQTIKRKTTTTLSGKKTGGPPKRRTITPRVESALTSDKPRSSSINPEMTETRSTAGKKTTLHQSKSERAAFKTVATTQARTQKTLGVQTPHPETKSTAQIKTSTKPLRRAPSPVTPRTESKEIKTELEKGNNTGMVFVVIFLFLIGGGGLLSYFLFSVPDPVPLTAPTPSPTYITPHHDLESETGVDMTSTVTLADDEVPMGHDGTAMVVDAEPEISPREAESKPQSIAPLDAAESISEAPPQEAVQEDTTLMNEDAQSTQVDSSAAISGVTQTDALAEEDVPLEHDGTATIVDTEPEISPRETESEPQSIAPLDAAESISEAPPQEAVQEDTTLMSEDAQSTQVDSSAAISGVTQTDALAEENVPLEQDGTATIVDTELEVSPRETESEPQSIAPPDAAESISEAPPRDTLQEDTPLMNEDAQSTQVDSSAAISEVTKTDTLAQEDVLQDQDSTAPLVEAAPEVTPRESDTDPQPVAPLDASESISKVPPRDTVQEEATLINEDAQPPQTPQLDQNQVDTASPSEEPPPSEKSGAPYHADIEKDDQGITITLHTPRDESVFETTNSDEQEQTEITQTPELIQESEQETEAKPDSIEMLNTPRQAPIRVTEPVLEKGSEDVALANKSQSTTAVKKPDKKQVLPKKREITHIVVKGDTLWDIAEHYVNNPFLYPELARLSKIKNPDLIYPGDRVRIIQITDDKKE